MNMCLKPSNLDAPSWSDWTLHLVRAAFEEDLGGIGDLTSAMLGAPNTVVHARLTPRVTGVICGLGLLPVLIRAFAELTGTELKFEAAPTPECERRLAALRRRGLAQLEHTIAPHACDGSECVAGAPVGTLVGGQSAVLTFERTCLNFLGRLSGIATLTRAFVCEAATAAAEFGRAPKICDTRKTLPGWRELDKYAVRCGGGHNHRMGLFDAVLIKDNHIAGIPVERLAHELENMLIRVPHDPAFVEVEVDSLDQFDEVCKAQCIDIILVDNFTPAQMAEAVRRRDLRGLAGQVQIEASGGVTLENVGAIARTGVDRIAVGALTHSAVSLDIGLDL